MKRNYFWVFFAVVILIGAYLFFSQSRQSQKQADGAIDSWSSYASPRFRIQLGYPAHWKPANSADRDRYEGYNGFLVISALGGAFDTVDQAMLKLVGGQIRPYGTDPKIEMVTVGGQEGRLILPSSDQPASKNREAALIVPYPHPVRYGSEFYRYVVIYADADHVSSIVNTLGFISLDANVLANVSGRVVFDAVCLTSASAKASASCSAAKDAFKERRVLVYDDTGNQLIQTVSISADGHYGVELEAGDYVLDINYVGLDRSAEVPAVLKLAPGDSKTVDIVINTGVEAPLSQ